MAKESPIRILVVDDDVNDRELIQEYLRFYSAKHDDFPTEVVLIYGTREELNKALGEPWDVIVVDYTIPGGLSWPAIYPVIREKTDAPVIVISGLIKSNRGLSVITTGATDYLSKKNIDQLGHAIHRAYLYYQAIKENRAAADSLINQANKIASKTPPG